MKTKYLAAAFAIGLIFTGCSSDDNPSGGDNNGSTQAGKYIIAATPEATQGVADYLLTAEKISEGTISAKGNGIEQDGTYRYYVTAKNKFFSLLYGQGNPGAVTTYNLNSSGVLSKLSNFQSETVQVFGPVNNEILMMKVSRNETSPVSSWYRLDTDKSQFVGEGTINTKDLANLPNGEIAHFSWIKQFGNKVLLPYFPIIGNSTATGNSFDTNHPDQAFIAVYSYPDMKLEKVIKDNRTSFIGRYFTDGIAIDEKGDAYAFSSSVATNKKIFTSTKPSAIIRIKANTLEFDDYYFNIEQATGGYYITEQQYAGNGKMLGFFAKTSEKGAYLTGKKLGIVDLYNRKVTWVTGMPTEAEITNITGRQNYVSSDKQIVSIGVTTAAGSYVYNIDVNSATAKQGIKVEGGKITGISRLEPSK